MVDQLSRYRQSIDNIDAALVYMLAERFKVTKAVGELKAREGLPPPIRAARSARSGGCASWRAMPISIPISPRNSCASSSTK